MEQNLLISFILPIYKVEKFLHECIDSVLAQTYKNLEIILVDDGSPDDCPRICDEYATKDSRIKVIHQANGGLSAARNAGLRMATGDYVIFLDSDDFHNNTEFASRIIDNLKENPVDIVLFKRTFCTEDGIVIKNMLPFTSKQANAVDLSEFIYTLAKNDELECNASLKVMRRQVLVNNNCFFKPKILSEDVEWYLRLLPWITSLIMIDIDSYYYRVRAGSITQTIGEKNIEDLTNTIVNVAMRWKLEQETVIKQVVLNYAAYQFFIVLGLLRKIPANRRLTYFMRLRDVSWITKYGFSNKNKKAKLVYSILGMRLSSIFFGLYIRKK